MSLYLLIVIVGLLIKSVTAVKFYTHFPKEYSSLRVELTAFFVVFITSSVVNLFIFSPLPLVNAMGIPIELVCRLYYVLDNLSTLVGAYLLLGMFGVKMHKSLPAVILVLAYFVMATYRVVFTDIHFLGIVESKYVTLAQQVSNDPYLIIPQLLAFLPLVAVIVALIKTYRDAKTNQSQIHNFYALIAFILFDISYISSIWAGLDNPMSMLLATRGFFFFFVISVTLLSREIFDIRHITPKTAENDTSSKLRTLFRRYSNEKIGHKEAIREMEKAMVEYKITKTIGFKEEQGSALPIVADSMKISRSGLYDVLKRLGISQPKVK